MTASLSFEAQLLDASRDRLLSLLTQLIRHLTITARFYAATPQGREGVARVDAAIKTLTAELTALRRPKEAMTAARAAAIAEAATPLVPADRLATLVASALD